MSYYENALEFGNLYRALKECCRNVRWKDSVIGYEANALKNTMKLRDDIISGRYKISPYQKFRIYEPKERLIVATRLRDRQWQRAMCNAGLYDDLTRNFIRDNVACQVGKGTDFMIKRVKTHLRRYYAEYGNKGWVLKCDIRQFFQSIPHSVAKDVLKRKITDSDIYRHVSMIVDSFDGDIGLGLGSQISQLTALAVLDDLDHKIKEFLRVKHYIRYMDDFILIHHDKSFLRECLKYIREELAELGLELNDKTVIYPLKQGVKFCKWRYIITDTGKIIMRIDNKSTARNRRKLKKLSEKEQRGEVPIGTTQGSMQCIIANMERGNTHTLRENLVNQIDRFRGDSICVTLNHV